MTMQLQHPTPSACKAAGPAARKTLIAAALVATVVLGRAAFAEIPEPHLNPTAPGTHNLFTNPDFDNNLSGWTLIGNVTFDASDDSAGSSHSGSADLAQAPGNSADLVQCVNLPIFWRSVNLSLGWWSKSVTANAESLAQIQYYAGANCTGSLLQQVQSAQGFPVSGWESWSAGGVVPPALAQSASVAFATFNSAANTSSASTHIDTVDFDYTINSGHCGQDPTLLCVDNNRFQIKATFSQACASGNGNSAAGVPDTAAGGFLWCFDPGNPEIFAKVLNACTPSTGNTYWVFLTGLTNLGVTITVTDTQTGHSRTYTNNNNTDFEPIFDTSPGLAVCP